MAEYYSLCLLYLCMLVLYIITFLFIGHRVRTGSVCFSRRGKKAKTCRHGRRSNRSICITGYFSFLYVYTVAALVLVGLGLVTRTLWFISKDATRKQKVYFGASYSCTLVIIGIIEKNFSVVSNNNDL